MESGFLYACAVVDWYSRYILSWEISSTLTTDFCFKAVTDALKRGQNLKYSILTKVASLHQMTLQKP